MLFSHVYLGSFEEKSKPPNKPRSMPPVKPSPMRLRTDTKCLRPAAVTHTTFAEELYGRAGGLAFIIPMLTSELTLVEHPTKSTYIERLPGYAGILFELYGCDKGDVLLIASNSGRNAYTVEMALLAKEKGCTVVAVTNLTHSSQSTSRHSSGKLLKDIADIVIDNCGGLGDAAYHVAGVEETMALRLPRSPMPVIAQAFSVKVAEVLHEKGIEVPVFLQCQCRWRFPEEC